MPRVLPGLAPAGGLVAGGLFALSIPPYDCYPLAWFCLVPALLCLHRGPSWQLGLAGGLLSGLSRIYWQYETLQLYGHLPALASLLTTGALVVYLALYWVVFFVVADRWRSDSPAYAWNLACLWVLLEWAQTWVISGFPWELLGYSQYLNLGLAQTAAVAGVYGVGFLLVLLNAGLAQLLRYRRAGLRLAGPALGCVLLAWSWGGWHLRQIEAEAPTGPPLRIGLVQGSIGQGEKWKGDRLGETTQRYVELAAGLAGEAPLDLVVFPETCLPFYFEDPRFAPYRDQFTALAAQLAAPLLVGSLDLEEDRIYNRAFLLDRQGQVIGHADKIHLVPFGEYLPMPWLFQYLEGLTAESGVFTAGPRRQVLATDETRLGVFVCYESVFPAITRELVQLGATLLINTTNDAWFGFSAAPYQHFSMCVLRAIETGRPVVRIANTGISGLVGPSGRILVTTPLFQPLARVVEVVPRSAQTLYARLGDPLLWFSGFFLLLPVARRRYRALYGKK